MKDYPGNTSHPTIPLRTHQLFIFTHCVTAVASQLKKKTTVVTYLRPKQFSCGQFEVSDIISFPPYVVKSIKFHKSLPYTYERRERLNEA